MDISKTSEIIRAWLFEHSDARLAFNRCSWDARNTRLTEVIDRWAGNEDTKELLRHIDAVSSQQITYAVVEKAMDFALKVW